MLDKVIIENLTPEYISSLDDKDLSDSFVLSKLGTMIQDSEYDTEAGKARDVYDTLSTQVSQYGKVLQGNPQKYGQLIAILLTIFWKGVGSINPKVRKVVISHQLLSSFMLQIDVKASVKRWLDVYENRFIVDKEARREFTNAMEKNDEMIGNKSITVDNKKFPPTLESWLSAYNSFARLAKERGKLEQYNFINSNPDVRQLPKSQVELLQRVLDLYDWLLFPPRVGEGVGSEEEDVPEAVSERFPRSVSNTQPRTGRGSPVIDKKLQDLRRRVE